MDIEIFRNGQSKARTTNIYIQNSQQEKPICLCKRCTKAWHRQSGFPLIMTALQPSRSYKTLSQRRLTHTVVFSRFSTEVPVGCRARRSPNWRGRDIGSQRCTYTAARAAFRSLSPPVAAHCIRPKSEMQPLLKHPVMGDVPNGLKVKS